MNNFTSISELLQQQSLDHHENLEMQMRRETLNQEILKQEAQRQGYVLVETVETYLPVPLGTAFGLTNLFSRLLSEYSEAINKTEENVDDFPAGLASTR